MVEQGNDASRRVSGRWEQGADRGRWGGPPGQEGDEAARGEVVVDQPAGQQRDAEAVDGELAQGLAVVGPQPPGDVDTHGVHAAAEGPDGPVHAAVHEGREVGELRRVGRRGPRVRCRHEHPRGLGQAAGALAFLLGGAAEDVQAVEPILSGLSAVRIHAGPVGGGATLKLMVNALFAVQVVAVGEVLALGEACGLPAARSLELLAPLPVTSKAAAGAGALIVADDHAPRFPVSLVEKDLRYAVQAGAGEVVEAARHRFAALAAFGLGAANLTVTGRIRD